MELGHIPDSGRELQFPPRATQWKERESLNRKSSQVSAKQPRELELPKQPQIRNIFNNLCLLLSSVFYNVRVLAKP